MNCRKLTAAWTLGLVATAAAWGPAKVFAQPGASAIQGLGSDAPNAEDVYSYGEELLRGPVHEAFAEQYSQDPIDGILIDQTPPPAVNEIPPQIRPEGENVEWLSGYWFWDDDRADFLWVSGTWRVMPPGQRWLPGYWAQAGDQYQWVSGSWVSAEQEAIEYIAQSPPASLDNGPVGIAPSESHFWIPGCWTWTQNDYAWRPGYWSGGHTNWVWVPQRYLWTPRGYVFSNGYWDFPLARRGTLFAPFYFNQPAYSRANFFYTPRVSILASLLQSHFWVRPRYHHYYFGDFYASNYRNAGIIPWHSYHRGVGFQSQRYSFDPLFVHASLYSRSGGGNFFQQVNNQYNVFVNQVDRRPALTYRDQQQRGDRDRERGGFGDDRFDRGPGFRDRNESMLGESIRDLVQREPNRFTRLTAEQVGRIRNDSVDIPNLISLRRENETASRGRGNNGRDRQELGIDRRSSERGDEERGGEGRGVSGRDSARNAARDSDSLVDRLQLPPTTRDRSNRDRSNRDRETAQSSDRSQDEERYSSGRPQFDRPADDRPNADRPNVDRPNVDRPTVGRPGADQPNVDQPNVDQPNADRPNADRPNTDRPAGDRPIGGRPPVGRPGADQPGVDRPNADRPNVDRPAGNRPTGERPTIGRPTGERPTIGRPSTDRPGRETGNAAPLSGSRISDQIRDRNPVGTLPGNRAGRSESGNAPPSSAQPRRTLPGIGTRPQIGAPTSEPLRTPGFGERTPGNLGSQMLTPNQSGRPSLNRENGSDRRNTGRPSFLPNSQRPNIPSTVSPRNDAPSQTGRPSSNATPSPTLRAPFSGGSAPSLRSGGPAPSSRPQAAPQSDRGQGRAQFTPQPGGGSRPESGPSLRGNRGGGKSDRGPGSGPRGKRD